MPCSFSSGVAFLYLRIKCSAIMHAPSTMIPKSIAPSDNKLAGMPVSRMRIKANKSANGIVSATTNADRMLPRKKIKMITTMETPANKVSPTVSSE